MMRAPHIREHIILRMCSIMMRALHVPSGSGDGPGNQSLLFIIVYYRSTEYKGVGRGIVEDMCYVRETTVKITTLGS